MAGGFDGTVTSEVKVFATHLGPMVIAMVATVFTWGLIDSVRRSLLQPWLLSKLPVKETRIELGPHEVVDLGDFYAAAMVWAVAMLILLLVWLIYTAIAVKSHLKLRIPTGELGVEGGGD